MEIIPIHTSFLKTNSITNNLLSYLEQDFKQSLKLFHDSIKDFQKSHLIEMKNLRSHEQRPLIY